MRMIPIMAERQCGDCKACCEGWIKSDDIHGETMYPGKPCHYICETGCSIYKNRPHDPCVSYECLWLKDNKVPGWMKPNKCGAILTWRKIEGIDYIEAIETGKKLDSSVLSWLIMFNVNYKINIFYQIEGGANWIGTKEFSDAMNNKWT